MSRQIHQIVETSYGEVMVKTNEEYDFLVDCYVGDDWDKYIGTIDGSVHDNSAKLKQQIEKELF